MSPLLAHVVQIHVLHLRKKKKSVAVRVPVATMTNEDPKSWWTGTET